MVSSSHKNFCFFFLPYILQVSFWLVANCVQCKTKTAKKSFKNEKINENNLWKLYFLHSVKKNYNFLPQNLKNQIKLTKDWLVFPYFHSPNFDRVLYWLKKVLLYYFFIFLTKNFKISLTFFFFGYWNVEILLMFSVF